jgi:Yip1 domain
MSIASDFNRSGIVERAKNILLKPNQTWDTIALEPATVSSLYRGYAVILAAIPPVAHLIGSQVFGYSFLGITYRPPLVGAIVGAIFGYVLALVSIYILALIVDALAPSFDGQKNRVQALKVTVYAYTAAWVAGIFGLIPMLGLLSTPGSLYSLYLLYLGLPKVMGAPQSKAFGYTAVAVIVAIVLSVVVTLIVGALGFSAMSTGMMGHLPTSSSSSDGSSGTLKIGGATIDLDKLKDAGKQMEAASKQIADSANGKSDGSATPAVTPVAVDQLKGLLPQSVVGYARGDVTANSGSVAGIGGSNAQAEYTKDGGAHFTLSITDMGAAGGFAAIASAFGVESSKETATGYQKVGKIGGRMTTEEWDRQSKNGKFSWLVANRFVVDAEGGGGDIEDLKQAVEAVKPADIRALIGK